MGMYDESWCNGCGTSVPYSDEDEHYCGDCAEDNVREDIIRFVKGRMEELIQRRVELQEDRDFELDDYLAGCIDAYDIVRMQLEK